MIKYSKLYGLLVVLLLASLILASCGKREPEAKPTPTPAPIAGWYWKPANLIDYAMSGMPDFDQKQYGWSSTAAAPTWSHCGPVAVANSLWWFDSKYEPSPKAPPIVNDNYPMVQSYSPVGAPGWDDHDSQNVKPLVEDLAKRMDTDGQSSGDGHSGTNVADMKDAIEQYLIDKGLDDDFYVHLEKSPEFEWIEKEIRRCQDVVLLLGFWQWQESAVAAGGRWVRMGGHYVTCAGVNSEESKLGISDPYWDNAEAGGEGRVPVAHAYPHNSSVHNDTKYVSHDVYKVVASTSPGGLWALDDYAEGKDVTNFQGQNRAADLLNYEGTYSPNLPVHVEIDYAVAVSPYVVPTPTPTATQTRPPTKTGGPTPTKTVYPPPVPTATKTKLPTDEPTEQPGETRTVQPTQTPKPTVCADAPVVTGIHSVHRAKPTGGGFTVEMHCIPAYFPNGTNIYDLHFFSGSTYLGSEYFDTPLQPCTTYTFDVSVPPGTAVPECITICLTDKNHNTWGRIASWLVGPTVVDLTTHLTDYGTGIWPGTSYWEIEIHPETSYFGPAGTPTSIYDLHFWTLEFCDPILLGEEYFQDSPLVSDGWYDFTLDVSASSPPPDVVLVEVSDATGAIWGVAWSWPFVE